MILLHFLNYVSFIAKLRKIIKTEGKDCLCNDKTDFRPKLRLWLIKLHKKITGKIA